MADTAVVDNKAEFMKTYSALIELRDKFRPFRKKDPSSLSTAEQEEMKSLKEQIIELMAKLKDLKEKMIGATVSAKKEVSSAQASLEKSEKSLKKAKKKAMPANILKKICDIGFGAGIVLIVGLTLFPAFFGPMIGMITGIVASAFLSLSTSLGLFVMMFIASRKKTPRAAASEYAGKKNKPVEDENKKFEESKKVLASANKNVASSEADLAAVAGNLETTDVLNKVINASVPDDPIAKAEKELLTDAAICGLGGAGQLNNLVLERINHMAHPVGLPDEVEAVIQAE